MEPGGVRGVRGVLGLAGSLGTQGSEGYWGHQGALGTPKECRDVGAVWRCQGVNSVVGGIRGVLGASRDSGYSGARRGTEASGGSSGV